MSDFAQRIDVICLPVETHCQTPVKNLFRVHDWPQSENKTNRILHHYHKTSFRSFLLVIRTVVALVARRVQEMERDREW